MSRPSLHRQRRCPAEGYAVRLTVGPGRCGGGPVSHGEWAVAPGARTPAAAGRRSTAARSRTLRPECSPSRLHAGAQSVRGGPGHPASGGPVHRTVARAPAQRTGAHRCDVIIAPVEFPPVRCYNRRPGVSIHAVTSEKVLLVITPFQRTIRDLLNVIGWAAMPIARSATHHVPLVPPPLRRRRYNEPPGGFYTRACRY